MTPGRVRTGVDGLVAASDRQAAWWRRAIVYQIYPRSFADSNGDGIGDLGGIVDRLDHLHRLGVDAIWLSPVYASPHADNGYDISDYRAIDPIYGTLDDLDRLVAGVHRRDMRLVMDLVVNHTSDEHAWFRESASSVDDPRRDWYWWRPPRAGHRAGEPGAEPTNWGSFFSGPTWTLDPATGEYYLHLFAAKQPDLNWEQPAVRSAVHEMMRWWLDRDIDGFRMDVINLISKDPALPDGEVRPGDRYGNGFPHYSCGPRLHEYLQEMRREVFAGRDRAYLTVGEMPGVSIEHARLATDPARGELDMVFQFEHVEVDHAPGDKWRRLPPDRARLINSLSSWQEGLAAVGWNSLYLGNHDNPRSVSRFGDPEHHWYASATALATMLHLLVGTPFIYQGDELGMVNGDFTSIDQLRDIESLNRHRELLASGRSPEEAFAGVLGATRDHSRTPIPWAGHGGFTSGTPWIHAPHAQPVPDAASQERDPGSVLHWYRRLIELRHRDALVVDGTFHRLDAPAEVFAYARVGVDGDALLVVVNLSDRSEEVHLPASIDVHGRELALRDRLAPEPILVNVGRAQVLDDGVVGPWQAVVHRTSPAAPATAPATVPARPRRT